MHKLHNNGTQSNPNAKDNKVQRVELHDNPHKALLHINSYDRTTESKSFAQYSAADIIKYNVSKIGVAKIDVDYNMATVNSRNKYVQFETASGVFNIVLTEGYYTAATLITEFITQLNTFSGASLCTFSAPLLNGTLYTLTGTIPFKFNNLQYKESLLGIKETAFVSSMIINVKALYTSYVDFVATTLKEGVINNNLFTKDNLFSDNSHLIRYYIGSGVREIKNIHYSLVRNRRLNNIVVECFDQYGQPLFESNVDDFSYNIDVSIVS